MLHRTTIYNSRNYSILLNDFRGAWDGISTTVEIILYYLTNALQMKQIQIYNSRNYSILLNSIYCRIAYKSTTVEIILYYLTFNTVENTVNLQQ